MTTKSLTATTTETAVARASASKMITKLLADNYYMAKIIGIKNQNKGKG